MLLAALAIVAGLALLIWSADRFIEGSAEAAAHWGVPPLLIGVVVVGFGTSAPEMVVSAIASAQGNSGIAIGNAYGSNITNIGLILGVTALVSPIAVKSRVLRRELPILVVVTMLAFIVVADDDLDRPDAVMLLLVFAGVMGWSLWQGLRGDSGDAFAGEMEEEIREHSMSLGRAAFWLVVGLAVLVGSSRLLVWGAVDIANELGVSDLVIGLTVVAAGTSLPELASSLHAVRKNEHDIALGNVIGSNIFNGLAVLGIAGVISEGAVDADVFNRDVPVMAAITLVLFAFAFGFNGRGRINRLEGGALFLAYAAYTGYLVATVV